VAGRATLRLLRDALSGASDGSSAGSSHAFEVLLHATVALELEPNQMLTERELMERTGSSRTALRSAVTRLAELGLITPHARKGLVIAPVDVLDISAVYDARLAIETALARLAAQRATREQAERLRVLAGQGPDVEADPATFVARDVALHLAIAAAARNQYLEDCLTRILPVSARLWHLLYREMGADQKFMFHHGDITAAIVARDPAGAEAAVREHLESARIPLPGGDRP
jgi:DNA-binding GntR family transcriptional regulator